ncbi:MAG TPA: S8 family serine peptidase [Gaiellaceae bacterium]|nr:S8 family serine peptidase [Gaiellaceae bacterium]
MAFVIAAAALAVAGATAATTASGSGVVKLAVGTFDPLAESPPVGPVAASTTPGAGPQYWLVQVREARFGEAAAAISAAGASIAGYVPEATYVVRATAEQSAAVAGEDAVRWVGFLQPGWRVDPAAVRADTADYRVYAFRDDPAAATLASALESIAGVTVLENARTVADVRAPASALAAIASLSFVEWVTSRPQYQLLNANARWVTDTGVRDLLAATAPGRLTGAGQTAAVADSGLNYAPDQNGRAHVDFRDCTGGVCKIADYTQRTSGSTPAAMDAVDANATGHRKVAGFFDIGGTGPNPYDESAHGTHVAGSVTGDSGTYGVGTGHDGMAPAARLVFQSIGTPGGGLTVPGDLYDLFRQAYRPRSPGTVLETSGDNGATDYANYVPNVDARTQNNSWSSANATLSFIADRFVWDHEDMVVVYSAGNGGPGAATFAHPSSAKNDLSSGASANGRQPMVSIDSMASFSSHGPTADGRFGPDVATPGQIVISARGGTVDAYHYLQGTSMSGPVLTGLATLVRQYFHDGYAASGGDGLAAGSPDPARRHNPSAALVKATLVNGAERMRGYYTGTDGTRRELDGQWPSSGQGWGRVNLDNSLYFDGDPAATWYHDVWRGDVEAFRRTSGAPQTRTYTLQVEAGEPLDVTLAWTDAAPSLPAGAPELVNNLDLEVSGPGGTYIGNNMNSRLSPAVDVAQTTPGPGAPDVNEVVERVRVATPAAGTYTITVRATSVALPNQGFALAASGRFAGVAAGPARQADAAGSPEISAVTFETASADTAVVRFTTSEPTTATATVGGVEYRDAYNASSAGIHGLNEGNVETSAEYSGKLVVGKRHEILLTGLRGGATQAVTLAVRDLAGNTATAETSVTPPSLVVQADAPDIGQLTETGGTAGWRTGTQLYAGRSGTLRALGAMMFRVPAAAVDPNDIIGATVEMVSAHDVVPAYTEDPLFQLDLLPETTESAWGTQDFATVRGATTVARLNAETAYRRGGGTVQSFAVSCGDLQRLKETLASVASGERRAAFRWDSTAGGLYSMDFGFNRRSMGPQLRPKLVLYTTQNRNPQALPCDPSTPAPSISAIGVRTGSVDSKVTVSWDTDVPSDSVVLFREQGTTAWTQVATPALTKLHAVQVSGLSRTKKYEFVVRSTACNGATSTDTNGGAGYDFYRLPATLKRWFTGLPTDQASKTGLATATFGDTAPTGEPPITQTAVGGANANLAQNPLAVFWTGTLPAGVPAGGMLEFEWWFHSRFGQVFVTTVDVTIFAGTPLARVHQQRTNLSVAGSPGGPVRNKHVLTLAGAIPPGPVSIQVTTPFVNNDFTAFYGAASTPSNFVAHLGVRPPGLPPVGPVPPASANASGLEPPPTRPYATPADVAAGTGVCGAPDLTVTALEHTTRKVSGSDVVTFTATVRNAGTAPAPAAPVAFALDGEALGAPETLRALAPGESATLTSQAWSAKHASGEHTVRATVDSADAVFELDETNNARSATFVVRGNKVVNGSFEQSSNGSSPDSWTSSGETAYSSGGSDGERSVTAGPGGSWTSAPAAVEAGRTYDLSVATSGAAGLVVVEQLSATGVPVGSVSLPTVGTGGAFETLTSPVTPVADAASVRVVLLGGLTGTTRFDDVVLSER